MRNSHRDDFSKIIATPGFQNIAAAIRHSTVIPQFRKAKKQGASYQVRYGLGQDLARQANYSDEFVAALSDFIRDYNRENEQFFERTKLRYRAGVRTNDIDEIVALIGEFGSRVVCNLLVAYGYARTPIEPVDTSMTTEKISEPDESADDIAADNDQDE